MSEELVWELDEERVNMMAHSAGRAVMELSLADISVTQEAITGKLVQYRRETGDAIGKGANRDGVENVRNGS